MKAQVFLVATPIGNLGDMSLRGIETLENVDFIACEDTRVSVKLLNHFNIQKPLISFFEHNKEAKLDYILGRISSGETCAVISDAGTPCISDPGENLVRACLEQGITITTIPGASAVISGLAVSGISTKKFTFEGFLSANKGERYQQIEDVKNLKHTLIFYEAPHKLLKTLTDLKAILGNRQISVIREISKIYEEILLSTLEESIVHFTEKAPRGEFVLVVEGCVVEREEITLEIAIKKAKAKIGEGYRTKDASKIIAIETGVKQSEIYQGLIK